MGVPAIVPRTRIEVPGTPPTQDSSTLLFESLLGSRAIARHATPQAGKALFPGQRTSSPNLRRGFRVLRTWISTSVLPLPPSRNVPSDPLVDPACPLRPPRLHPASAPARTTPSRTLRHISLGRYTPQKGSTSLAPPLNG
jgi:hypothetical protein